MTDKPSTPLPHEKDPRWGQFKNDYLNEAFATTKDKAAEGNSSDDDVKSKIIVVKGNLRDLLGSVPSFFPAPADENATMVFMPRMDVPVEQMDALAQNKERMINAMLSVTPYKGAWILLVKNSFQVMPESLEKIMTTLIETADHGATPKSLAAKLITSLVRFMVNTNMAWVPVIADTHEPEALKRIEQARELSENTRLKFRLKYYPNPNPHTSNEG